MTIPADLDSIIEARSAFEYRDNISLLPQRGVGHLPLGVNNVVGTNAQWPRRMFAPAVIRQLVSPRYSTGVKVVSL
jgi:hypothetical protein